MLTLYVLYSLCCYESRPHVSQAGIVTGVVVITRSLKLRVLGGPMQVQTFDTFSAKSVYPLPTLKMPDRSLQNRARPNRPTRRKRRSTTDCPNFRDHTRQSRTREISEAR